MPTRRTASRTTPARGTARKATPAKATAPARKVAAKAAPVRKVVAPPVEIKEPTPYHKAYATYLIREVGYEPNDAKSAREAFLMGVSLATVKRNEFGNSDFLEEWREKNNVNKRGPKPKATDRSVVPDDEFDADDDDELDDEEIDEDDESDDDDEFDSDDDEDEEDDDEDEDEEDEPEPAPRRRGRPTKAVKAAPAKSAPRGRKPAASDDDDDILF